MLAPHAIEDCEMIARKWHVSILLTTAFAATFFLCPPAHLSLRGDEPEVKTAPFELTDQYAIREFDGWKVYLNTKFENDKPDLCADTLALLRVQLYQITRMVPAPAVEKLQKIAISVELEEPHH